MGTANSSHTPTDPGKGGLGTQGAANQVDQKIEVSDMDFKVNAYKLDVSKTQIFRYDLKIYPADLCHKERKALEHKFLIETSVDMTGTNVVLGDHFKIYLPYHERGALENSTLRATIHRVDSSEPDCMKVVLRGEFPGRIRVAWSKIASSELVDKASILKQGSSSGTSSCGILDRVKLCEVSAYGTGINVADIEKNGNAREKDEALAALDTIFRKGMRLSELDSYGKHKRAKQLLVDGEKVFDLDGTGRCVGFGTELCFGVSVSTRMFDGGFFRVSQPCHAFFKDVNIAELVGGFFGLQPDQSDLVVLESLLQGVSIQKEFGTGRSDVIVGLGQPPSSQQFEWHARNLVISVKDYIFQVNLTIPKSHEHLPCIKIGGCQNPVYLPMSFCRIVPGQRARRTLGKKGLLQNTNEVFDWKKIESHIRQTRAALADESSEFGIAFLRNTMCLKTLGVFEIGIDLAKGACKPLSVPQHQVKKLAEVSGKVLAKNLETPKATIEDHFRTAPCLVVIFAKQAPSNLQGVPKALFKGHDVFKSLSVVWAGPESIEDLKSKVEKEREKIGDGNCGIVFGIWNKVDSADPPLQKVYKQLKQFCNAKLGCLMTAVSVENLAQFGPKALAKVVDQPIKKQDVDKLITSALQKLLAIQQIFGGNIKSAAVASGPTTIFLAVHVAETLPLPARTDGTGRRGSRGGCKAANEKHDFLVTLATCFPSSLPVYKTLSFLQPCAKEATGGWSIWKGNGGFPGIQDNGKFLTDSLDQLTSDAVTNIRKVVIFRSGVLPPATTVGEDLVGQEMDFLKRYADGKDWASSYAVCRKSNVRLIDGVGRLSAQLSSTAPAQTNGATYSKNISGSKVVASMVPSQFADSAILLLRKKTSTGSSPRAIHLSLLHGVGHGSKDTEAKDFCEDVFAASWAFPTAITSAKDLAPVVVARKAIRYFLRYGIMEDGNRLGLIHAKVRDASFYL